MAEPKQAKSRAGRIVVYTVFWSIALAVMFAILGSVVANLYGKPPTAGSSDAAFAKRQRTWCLRTLIGLRDELDVELTHELAYTTPHKPAMQRWNAWVGDWKQELEAATVRCTGGHDPDMTTAYEQLGGLFEAYAQGVAQIARSRTELAAGLGETVQRMARER